MAAPTTITAPLIAPCGMNCAICLGHLREKRHCPGCTLLNQTEDVYVRKCVLRLCQKRGKRKHCFACGDYPCRRLKQLDKRYRLRYGMSMLENLAFIREQGIRAFVRQERVRWQCRSCGNLVCVHRENCLSCGAARRP
ncbi:MAG: DUF3795 domain-containing protein [candidate division FCPU426 bacterium]